MNLFDFLWFRLGALFVLGAVIGSFLNVCIHRLPWRKNIIWPGSRCPRCETPIHWYDNIPMISWLALGGRCRKCRGSISPRYFFVELLTASLFAVLYWMEVQQECLFVPGGPPGSGGAAALAAVNHWRYFYHLFLLCAMIVATFIDVDYQIIPDSVTVPGMIAGFGIAALVSEVHLVGIFSPFDMRCYNCFDCTRGVQCAAAPFLGHEWHSWLGSHPHVHSFAVSLAGWIVGGGTIWVVRVVGRVALGKEAMGFGDVTLMAMIGSFLGWQAVLVVFFLAPVFALLLGLAQWILRGDSLIPYGPFLCLGALATLFIWEPIWGRFEGGEIVWHWYAARLHLLMHMFGYGMFLAPLGLIVLLAVLLVGVRLFSALVRGALGLPAGDDGYYERWEGRGKDDLSLDAFDLYLRRRNAQESSPRMLPRGTSHPLDRNGRR